MASPRRVLPNVTGAYVGSGEIVMTSLEQSMATILVIDDHPIVHLGIEHFLGPIPDDFNIVEATTQRAALSILREQQVDLAIVDICLPDGSGIEFIRSQRQIYRRTRWLVLSAFDEALDKARARNAGADGYLCKRAIKGELYEAVKNVLSGSDYPRGFREAADEPLNAEDTVLSKLTEREWTIFRMIAEGKPVQEIAQNLARARKTINATRDNIRLKLGLGSSAELARFAAQWYFSCSTRESAGGSAQAENNSEVNTQANPDSTEQVLPNNLDSSHRIDPPKTEPPEPEFPHAQQRDAQLPDSEST